jgi:hypothetical protein
LQYGVEWNLRLVSSDDERTFKAIRKRFDHLLAVPGTKILTRAVIDAFAYCGPLNYESHESEAPMRVRFILHHALPDPLWKLWSR